MRNASISKLTFLTFIVGSLLLVGRGFSVFASEVVPERTSKIQSAVAIEEMEELQREVKDRKAASNDLEKQIANYKTRLIQLQSKSISLQNELEILFNRMEETRLTLRSTQEKHKAVATEIKILNLRVGDLETRLARDRESLEAILVKMNAYDDDFGLRLFFGTDSFAELFERLASLQNITDDLSDTLARVKTEKDDAKRTRAEKEGKRARLQELASDLLAQKMTLENEENAKNSLLAANLESETEFKQLLAETREEQAYINRQIEELQDSIQQKLKSMDASGNSSVLSWPVDPSYKGVSATFHDPTYPFRRLFEHSGLDIPEPMGTIVKSAAPGYVAWTRTGVSYGNYVMVIHTDGVATLYAHLSKISVKADDFVARGEEIGRSGGKPGTRGAGLSTGPHLHFEVRRGGIPVDPTDYLPSL